MAELTRQARSWGGQWWDYLRGVSPEARTWTPFDDPLLTPARFVLEPSDHLRPVIGLLGSAAGLGQAREARSFTQAYLDLVRQLPAPLRGAVNAAELLIDLRAPVQPVARASVVRPLVPQALVREAYTDLDHDPIAVLLALARTAREAAAGLVPRGAFWDRFVEHLDEAADLMEKEFTQELASTGLVATTPTQESLAISRMLRILDKFPWLKKLLEIPA